MLKKSNVSRTIFISALKVWLKQGLRLKDTVTAVCVVRDDQHFAKLLVTRFTPNVKINPKVGDKIQMVALASYGESGTMQFEGEFSKLKILDDNSYSSLTAAASPGKVG